MRTRETEIWVGDLETTVYDGQECTAAWASALVKLNTEDVHVFHSIGETLDYIESLDRNITIYYHNLKFDGTFWISYLLTEAGYTQAIAYQNEEDSNEFEWCTNRNMPRHSLKYLISDMGQWYTVTIKTTNRIIELRDSLKLLPFSVDRIGKSFNTLHKKLSMEYTGVRFPGCEITPEEMEYIKNDVLVVKEALEFMVENGHKKMTIGSCCLQEYKSIMGKKFDEWFPPMLDVQLSDEFGSNNAEEYIRKAYRGGWTYLVKGKEKRIYGPGITADVNSLYPSRMHSSSGCYYPVGLPTFWKGDYIPDEALTNNRYYFIRLRTQFYLKPNYLPTIQVKNTLLYKATEYLESSDIYDPETDCYYDRYLGIDGKEHLATIELTLTMTDFNLIKRHYDLVNTEILDGCWFETAIGIFDEYIDKYREIKVTSKGAMRELAKLFLNNLYGKMASGTNSSFKVCYMKPDSSLGFYTVTENKKKPVYIPVGAAITSYAREFTISAAQKNYYGPDCPGFIYADTDSIHCDIAEGELVDVPVHPTEFNHWKVESYWNVGWYVRAKTYIEHITREDGKECDPYYLIKCAGMPERSKRYIVRALDGDNITTEDPENVQSFLSHHMEVTDFREGLRVPGKLIPRRIPGGIVLQEVPYEMR